MPLILLRKPTPKDAVCQVFEKVNTGGVSLTVFELMTATFAAENYPLRDDWRDREKRLKQHKVLKKVQSDDLLQAISLLATSERRRKAIGEGTSPENAPGISCKRKEILKLTLDEYRRWAEPVTVGFERAAKLLYSQKIFDARDLPYRTQVVPLAATYAMLGDRASHDGVRSILVRWYWCGVFGELYGSAVETQFAKDVPELLTWVDGGSEPTTVQDANFIPARLLTLRTRNSAAYKGVSALLLRDGALDFRTGEFIEAQMYFDDRIDIHHIFPREWCRKHEIEAKYYDSIVNKTPLAAKTNRTIGGRAPSSYLDLLQRQSGIVEARMDEILNSHVIYPLALRLDEFQEFFKEREEALLSRIESAMGKAIMRDAFGIEDEYLESNDEIEEDED